MKKFLPALLAAITLVSVAHGGPDRYLSDRSKETVAQQPCPNWYADREWNVSLWGTYAFPDNDYPTLQNTPIGIRINGGPPGNSLDRYIEADHAWGGGIDAKYFFARYFAIGLQGYVLDARQSYPDVFVNFFNVGGGINFARTSHDQRAVGSVLGTFTLRYPIGCSRFAPYLFVGGGGIMGGGQTSVIDTTSLGDIGVHPSLQRHYEGGRAAWRGP